MTLIDLIGWAIFGLLVGLVARFLMPGRDRAGCFLTMVLGIVGAVVGGWLGRALGFYSGESEPVGFLMAVVGAFVVLAVFKMIR